MKIFLHIKQQVEDKNPRDNIFPKVARFFLMLINLSCRLSPLLIMVTTSLWSSVMELTKGNNRNKLKQKYVYFGSLPQEFTTKKVTCQLMPF